MRAFHNMYLCKRLEKMRSVMYGCTCKSCGFGICPGGYFDVKGEEKHFWGSRLQRQTLKCLCIQK